MKLVIIVNVDISYFLSFNEYAKNMRFIASAVLHVALYYPYNFNSSSQIQFCVLCKFCDFQQTIYCMVNNIIIIYR